MLDHLNFNNYRKQKFEISMILLSYLKGPMEILPFSFHFVSLHALFQDQLFSLLSQRCIFPKILNHDFLKINLLTFSPVRQVDYGPSGISLHMNFLQSFLTLARLMTSSKLEIFLLVISLI